MQPDLFRPIEQVEVSFLREKKSQLVKDLDAINAQIREISEKRQRVEISPNLWLSVSSSPVHRTVTFYRIKEHPWRTDNLGAEIELLGAVDIDKLSKAIQQLAQETQNDAQGIPASNGSQSAHPPW